RGEQAMDGLLGAAGGAEGGDDFCFTHELSVVGDRLSAGRQPTTDNRQPSTTPPVQVAEIAPAPPQSRRLPAPIAQTPRGGWTAARPTVPPRGGGALRPGCRRRRRRCRRATAAAPCCACRCRGWDRRGWADG